MNRRLLVLVAWIVGVLPIGAVESWATTRGMGGQRSAFTATPLPNGKILVAGGTNLNTCELYDPARGTWTSTGSMAQARGSHTATLLLNGKVLVAGGYFSADLATCEIYDPGVGTWSSAATMPVARSGGTATRLLDGRVLVVGGTAHVYDPTSNTWSAAPGLSVARGGGTATLLADGRVLVAGGASGSTQYTACDLFIPTTSSWSVAANMGVGRDMHTATLLPNGKVLVTGGFDRTNLTSRTTCEEYDPAANAWTARGSMANGRRNHTAVLLPGSGLMVVGGGVLACELYNPASGVWAATVASPFGAETATLLPTGHVLAATGSGCALFMAASPAWQNAGTLANGYLASGAHLLPNGKVLAAACFETTTSAQKSNEYDPQADSWAAAGDLSLNRSGCPTALLKTGKVLIAGSTWTPFTSCQLYDPTARTWAGTGAMVAALRNRRLTVLASGQVLASGGETTGSTPVSTTACELYDPLTGTWTATGPMGTARTFHTVTLLPDGKVLAVGGYTQDPGLTTTLASGELYDPQTGSWSYTGSLTTFRYAHAATLLPSGRVLVTGGKAGSSTWSSSELYEPLSGEWTVSGVMATARSLHSAIVLPSGRVLVSGGQLGTGYETASCEEYEPIGGTWLAAPSLAGARYNHASTLLPDGSILVTGGGTQSIWQLSTSERYVVTVDAGRRPTIASAVQGSDRITVTGTGFTPAHSASGDGTRSSATNQPSVSWRRNDNGRIWWLSPLGVFSATATERILPIDAVGDGLLTVHVGGLASASTYLRIDPPSIILTASASTISENGGTSILTVTASRAFAWPITVTLSTSGVALAGTDFSLGSTTLTIPAGSLSAATTLTATPDVVVELGGETASIDIGSVANGVESGTQQTTITITDYQSPGFTVSPISRHTTEAGQTASFTVQPSSPPLYDVTLNLASTDSTEGVVSGGASLVFTSGNWTTARTVTVTGVDDAIDDGDVGYQVIGSSTSSDPDYNNRAMPAVAVVNDDDDAAGISIAAPVGFITEGGGSATVGISLASQPTGNVTVGVVSGTTAQGTVGASSLSFTPANWNIPQSVTVTGADGDNADNPTAGTTFSLTATITAGPTEYPTSITASRSLTCYPSNAAPVIAAVAAQSVVEDSTGTTVNLSGIGAGGGTEVQTLTVTATSSDPTVLQNPVVSYTTPGATGSLALLPVGNATGSVMVTVRVTDDATIGRAGAKDTARFTEITFPVTVTALNDAPVLVGPTAAPWTQAEDDLASAGTLIGAILGGLTITDADSGAQRGLAITAAETTHGSWQYNLGAGWNGVGAVAEVSARLLADDGATRLRFVPAADYNGPASVTIRAWDRSSGTNGQTADATTTGGTTAFSSATATATVTVTPVNDAPVLSTAAANPLTAVTGGQANPGTPIAAMIQGLVSDVDGDPQGIAITAITGTGGGGVWQYSTDSGTNWNPLAGAAPATARLLSDAGSTLVRYLPVANEAGTASLSFRAWDRSAGSAGGTGNASTSGGTSAYSSVLATSTVTVSSGNAAPIISLPTSLLSYTENQAATPLDPAATVVDVDSADFAGGTLTAQITLGASSADRLTVQPMGGVTVAGSTVSVSGTAVATLAGGTGATPLTLAWNSNATPTLAQTVVKAISFANISDDPSTAVRIVRVTTSDGDGATSFPVTVTVTVAAVNDPPVLAAIPASATYVEDAAALILDAAMTVTDPDSPTFSGGTFSATLTTGGEATDILAVRHQGNGAGQIGVAGAQVSYAGTVFSTVSGGIGEATPLVVLLDANASQAAVQALMRNLTFRADSQHPSATARTVSLRLSDGNGGTSAAEDILVPVQPVNDAPSATVSSTAWQVNPSQLNSIPLGYLAIQDVDQPSPVTLVATITAVPAAGTIAVNGSPRSVGGTFTERDLEQAVVTYTAPASEGSYTLSFTIADGQASVPTVYTLPIQVTSAISNIPPVVTLDGTPTWTEDLPPVQVDPAATVTDADNPVLNAITATVTNGSNQDVLSLRDGSGVAVSGGRVLVDAVEVGTVSGGTGSTPLRVTLNGAATVARVQRVVRSVSFAVADANPSTATRTVEVKVNDGAGGEGSSTIPVDVIAVNSPPVVTLRTNIAVNEDAAAVAIDPAALCSDVDSVDFAGGSAQVVVTGGGTEDQLAIANQGSGAGQIGVSGGLISFAGGQIGTAVGGVNGTTLTITLSAAANDAAVQALLRALTYANSSQEPQLTRSLTITVSDGDGGSTVRSVTVVVQTINDAPVVTIPDVPITWTKGPNAAQVFAGGSGVTVMDVDTPAFANGRMTIHLSAGASATDRLTVANTAAITVAQDGTITSGATVIGSVSGGDNGTSPLIISLNAQATPARVVDLLLAVAFDTTVDIPSTQPRTVAVVLEDGEGGISTQVSRTVNVVVTDDPPVITLTGSPLAYTENDPATRLDPAASVTDTIAVYAGSTLTIEVDAWTADDRIAIGAFAGIELSGNEVRWNSLPIGTLQPAVRPSRLDILLNASAAPASVAALLQAVTYTSLSEKPPASRTVKIAFAVANFTTSVLAARTVAITEVNDAPAPTPVVLTTERQVATGTWEAKDPDDTTFTWSIVSGPSNGTLTLTNALTGYWSFAPTGTGTSSAVIRVVDARGLSSGDIVVPVVVSTATDAKPVVDSDPPLHVHAGQTWSYDLSVSAASVATVPDLEVEAIGAPPGLTIAPITPAGSRRVSISWLTTGATPGSHVRFHLRVSDRTSLRTVVLPVVVYVRAPLAGGG